MANIKTNTIFSKIPPNPSGEAERAIENRKLNYWLEKLHIQGEKVRKDDNRREEQTKVDETIQALNDQPVGKKAQTLTQSGINEHTKNIATKKQDDIGMVNDLVKKSNRIIISISSQFPWDLFPSTIDVEESRVTFKFNQFLSSQSHSVDLKDISNVFIETSMLFASLQVVSRTFVQNDIKIGNLNKTEAKKVQGIIEGLRTFAEHDINTSNYEIDELIAKLGELNTSDITP
ncbi:MAG: hypothetical protein Q8Q49_04935 [bacterium]|nr:hypothetical protein [bacterium]